MFWFYKILSQNTEYTDLFIYKCSYLIIGIPDGILYQVEFPRFIISLHPMKRFCSRYRAPLNSNDDTTSFCLPAPEEIERKAELLAAMFAPNNANDVSLS
jgi:hypothetical protein